MSMIAFIGIYMAGCSQEQSKKETTSSIQEKNKDTKEDAPVEKLQEQEKNEESQAIKTNEQVEHKQEEMPAEEKIEETTPVLPTEQPVQNNEQKVESNEKQEKFLVVIDPGHQQKANLNLEPIGPGATTQKYKVTDGSENPNQSGFAVLTPAEDSPYTKEIYAESLQISQMIVNKMRENQQVKVNGIKFRDDLSGFNWSKVPGVLLELGFMSNLEEDKKLSDPQYVNSLLQSVTDSIDAYRKRKA
ncbi:N-acetylmuramoyl-L-alanine amidase [Bacillus thuringiensis]|nr:N-acetylmuramoyl-L-alanine amidase [Bacillus thuringiensis]PFW23508.1 N-acetylmuramoyl-L-alanine amidase [Bacillus thuringiensis]PGQ28133.1 N-acetylmuramoyl-L-alanine amidase [Bacillus thuringiensis]